MLWGTLFMFPRTSEAELPQAASCSCIEQGRIVGGWFEKELPRRALTRTYDKTFDQMLRSFNRATSQCASGLTETSTENFLLLERSIAALEERRIPEIERE